MTIPYYALLDAFLVEAQLPPALARWLAGIGHHAEHVVDVGMAAASDTAILEFAMRTSTTIITKDEDFAQRKAMSNTGPPVVWLRLPNARRAYLLAWFERALPDILSALDRGETLVEVV